MLLCYRLADGRNDRINIQITVLALDFLYDHEPLFVGDLNRKRCATAGSQGRVALFYRQFDVLGVVVAATDDDEILEPTGNK